MQSPGPTPASVTGTFRAPPLPQLRGERIQRLGKGGYGEVWKVRYLNSEEAWKYIPKRPGSDFQAFREAFNSRRIEHPHIVRIQDIEEDANYYILRMDLVRGRDLHQVVEEEGVLPPVVVCRYAAQIAGALEAAHQAGILHLDLKPSNLILKEDGETVMITDFGISATMGKGLFQVDPVKMEGTPYFLAPEQLLGQTASKEMGSKEMGGREAGGAKLGPGVDIWAFGITLYYLLSRTYPFPFSGGDPKAILETPPRPLPEIVPYVPEELWAIVVKMLQRDPAGRYARMSQVEAALRGYLDEITCPACKRTFLIGEVQGSCPETRCPEPRGVVVLKEKRLLMRTGDSFFSRCEHSKAIESYRKVIQIEEGESQGPKQLTGRAQQLIAIIEKDRQELAERLDLIHQYDLSGDLLRTLREIENARQRFSAMREVRRVRKELLEKVRERYATVNQEVPALVRQGRFADAKLILTQIEAFLENPAARRHLLEGMQSQSGEMLPVKDLFGFVEEREHFYRACRQDLDQQVGSLQLEKASATLQRLQKHFPSSENIEKIRLFGELQDALEVVRKFDPKAIESALDPQGGGFLKEAIEPARVQAQCDFILQNLDQGKVPQLAEIADRRGRAAKIIAALLSLRDRFLKDLEAAEKKNWLREQVAALEKLAAIADRTDLLPAEETARFRDRYQKLQRVLERAIKKYEEGKQHLKDNNFGRAQACFEEADRIAPLLFADVQEKVAQCQDLAESNRKVGEQINQLYNRIMGSEARPEEIKTYFQLTQKIETRQESETLVLSVKNTQNVIARLLSLQAARIHQTEDEAQRLKILSASMDCLLALPADRVVSHLELNPGLNEKFLAMLGRIFAPFEKGKAALGTVEARLGAIRGIINELCRLQAVVRRLKPLEFHPHPAERASNALLATRETLLSHPSAQDMLNSIVSLHDELNNLVDDVKVKKRLEKNRGHLVWIASRKKLKRAVKRFFRSLGWVALPLAAAAAAFLAASFYYGGMLKDSRLLLAGQIAGASLRDGEGKEAALPEDLRQKILASERDWLEFVARCGALRARHAEETALGAGAGAEGGWPRLLVQLSNWLAQASDLKDLESAAAGTEEGKRWNALIEKRLSSLAGRASEEVQKRVGAELKSLAQGAASIDPAQPSDRHVKAALERLKEAMALGEGLAGKAGELECLGILKAGKEWLEKLLASGGQPLVERIKNPPGEEIELLAHAYLLSEAADQLSRRARSALSKGGAEKAEELLFKSLGDLVDYRDAALKDEKMAEAISPVKFLNSQDADDAIGNAVVETMRKILKLK